MRQALGQLWDRLTRPSEQLEEPEDRYAARGLATYMLYFLLIGTLAAIASISAAPPEERLVELVFSAITFLVLLIPYGLSRSRYFRATIWTSTFLWYALAVYSYSTQPDAHLWLIYLLVPIFVAMLYSSNWTTLGLTVTALGLAVSAPVLVGNMSLDEALWLIFTPLLFVAGLLVLVGREYNRIEGDRRARLAATATELREARDHLEQRVQERTQALEDLNRSLEQEISERVHAEEALRRNERRSRLISEIISDLAYVCRIEPDGRVVLEWTSGQFGREEIGLPEIGQPFDWSKLPVHPDDRELMADLAARGRRSEVVEGELRLLDAVGKSVWVRVYNQVERGDEPDGRPRVYGGIQDVSSRKQIEEKLRHRNQELAALNSVIVAGRQAADLDELMSRLPEQLRTVLQVPAGVIVLYEYERDIFVPAASWGVSPEILEGLPFGELCEQAIRLRQVAFQPDIRSWINDSALATDRSVRMWRSHVCIPLTAKDELQGVLRMFRHDAMLSENQVAFLQGLGQQLGVLIQNTRLYQQLQLSHAQARHLAQQVVTAQEEERRRMASELHDEAGQTLAALKLGLALMRDYLPADGNGNGEGTAHVLRKHIDDAVQQVEDTMARIRRLAHGLRPAALDDLGLGPALEGLCAEMAERAGLPIDWNGEAVPPLSDAAEISLYRFLQEALTNITKHAHAKQVWVRLRATQQHVALSVRDDGIGFNKATLAHHGGLGLLGMQERLQALRGRLEIIAAPGQGTYLQATVPASEFRLVVEGEDETDEQHEPNPDREIRVVLAEDHHLVRSAVADLLRREPGIDVVGEAVDGRELVPTLEMLRPDLLLLDLHMPNQKPTEAVLTVRARFPELRLLVLSAYDRREYVVAMHHAGVDGYVLKHDAPETLVEAIRTVVRGRPWWSPRIARLLQRTDGPGSERNPLDELTQREREVLQLMVDGCSNEQIAEVLVIAAQTVRNHNSSIYRKLQVSNRLEAVLEALRLGMTSTNTVNGEDLAE